MIRTAIKAAKAAGKILVENYCKIESVSVKQDKSLVTEVDSACEKKIREIILAKHPDHSIVGEEEGDDHKDSDYKWIIDPLDGTHNYFFKSPIFGVSIGLAYKNEPIAGVIYLPILKELYSAERGKGCFLNGKKMLIKDKPLKESLVSFSSWYFRSNSGDAQAEALKFFSKCFEIRVNGCAVFNLAGVLKNTFGVMLSKSNKDWDVAAGVIMIKEAGGVVTDYSGIPWKLGNPNIIAGNKTCHKDALELMG
ncbi:MAG: inositol monophosphatase [Nanoarchaeota archaeon]|nr:inositol monophosphatase [Nanoarchaeota archaeon]